MNNLRRVVEVYFVYNKIQISLHNLLHRNMIDHAVFMSQLEA
jgi:hypothetical protein